MPPKIDADEVRILAERMAAINKTARKEFRHLLNPMGATSIQHWMPTFKTVVRLFLDTHPAGANKQLMDDLNRWAAKHGTLLRGGTALEDMLNVTMTVRYTSNTADDLTVAATRRNMDVTTYIREATLAALARDLGKVY